jgi:Cu/Zn superoxide dismutase
VGLTRAESFVWWLLCCVVVSGWEVARLYYRLMGADGNLHFLTQVQGTHPHHSLEYHDAWKPLNEGAKGLHIHSMTWCVQPPYSLPSP